MANAVADEAAAEIKVQQPVWSPDDEADELLQQLQGSAAEVVQATGLKVESMQKAITWLITQQKQHVAQLHEADADRAALRTHVAALQGQLQAATQQSAGVDELKAAVTQAGAQLEALAAKTSKELEAAAAAASAVSTAQAALDGQVEAVAARALKLEEGAAHAATEVRSLQRDMGKGSDHLEGAIAEQLAKLGAQHDAALAALTADRLEPIEQLGRATSSRLGDVEAGLDVRLQAADQRMANKLEEQMDVLNGRVMAAEQQLAAAMEGMEAASQNAAALASAAAAAAAASKPQSACAVAPTSSASAALDEGESKGTFTGRLGHVEWLLDALQGDHDAMHASILKIRAKQEEHSEQIGDLRSAAAAAFEAGSSRGASPSGRGVNSVWSDEPSVTDGRAPRPSKDGSRAPASAPASSTASELISVAAVEARVGCIETELARVAEARGEGRGGGVSVAIHEAIDAQVTPLKRQVKLKAETSELARLDAKIHALMSSGGSGGGVCGGETDGGANVAMALAEIAGDAKRFEQLRDAIDELSAHHEQVCVALALPPHAPCSTPLCPLLYPPVPLALPPYAPCSTYQHVLCSPLLLPRTLPALNPSRRLRARLRGRNHPSARSARPSRCSV